MALSIGDAAPEFELRDHTGRLIRLRDFRGKCSVVLAFYVYANTPGWAQQLQAYQDGLAAFEQAGAKVLGISVNKPEANRTFAEKLGLTFPLLCDTEKKVSRQYGVLGFLHVAKRTTFVIDTEGVIRLIDRRGEAMDPAGARQACSLLANSKSWRLLLLTHEPLEIGRIRCGRVPSVEACRNPVAFIGFQHTPH